MLYSPQNPQSLKEESIRVQLKKQRRLIKFDLDENSDHLSNHHDISLIRDNTHKSYNDIIGHKLEPQYKISVKKPSVKKGDKNLSYSQTQKRICTKSFKDYKFLSQSSSRNSLVHQAKIRSTEIERMKRERESLSNFFLI